MSTYSPFLALAAELRLQIYSHVFSVSETYPGERTRDPCTGSDANGGSASREYHGRPWCLAGEVQILISDTITSSRSDNTATRVGPHFTAILQTCRRFHDEAVDVLYQQTQFWISLGARGEESVDRSGKLCLQTKTTEARKAAEGGALLLRDLSLFEKMQNVHLSLDFGRQVNPIWDALPVIRAVVATLNPDRKRTTASLCFGLMTAITCARISDEPWKKFVQELKSIDLGCVPDIEMDQDAESWTKHRRKRFEDFAADTGGELKFVRFEGSIGLHDEGLRACVIL